MRIIEEAPAAREVSSRMDTTAGVVRVARPPPYRAHRPSPLLTYLHKRDPVKRGLVSAFMIISVDRFLAALSRPPLCLPL
ncbi:MAG: hypothetical protein ACE5H0_11985 [Bacteroidota bacterium]